MFSNKTIFDAARKCRLDGKNVLITGANTGIGLETAKECAHRGAKVTIMCRNETKMKVALDALNAITPFCAQGITCDLKSFDSVRQAAAETKKALDHIDICILNAGIMLVPVELIDGIESEQYVNHFSHFLLLAQLYPLLQAAPARPRVVSLSSAAHGAGDGNPDYWKRHESVEAYNKLCKDSGSSFVPYGNSKLANVLHMRKMAEIDADIGFYAVHPGIVDTELGRYWAVNSPWIARAMGWVISMFQKTAVQGAQTSLYCAMEPELEAKSGLYYADVKEAPLSGSVAKCQSKLDLLQDELWTISKEITKCGDFK